MLPEKALTQLPFFRQQPFSFHERMDPSNGIFACIVLDPMTCDRIIFHDLSSAALAFFVNLEEDHVASLGHAKLVLINKPLYHHGVQNGFQERGERTLFRVKREGTGNVFIGDSIRSFHCGSRVIVPLSQLGHVGQWDKLSFPDLG